MKDVKDLSVSDQFRIYEESNLPIDLFVSPKNETISNPLQNLIQDSGGTINIFDSNRNLFHGYDFNSGTYNINGKR